MSVWNLETAYHNTYMVDRYCFERHAVSFIDLTDPDKRAQIEQAVADVKGGLYEISFSTIPAG